MDQMKAKFVRLRQQHIFAKMPFPMVPKRSLSSVNSSSPPSPSPTSTSTTSSSGIDEEIDVEIVEPISEFDQQFERINHQNGKTVSLKFEFQFQSDEQKNYWQIQSYEKVIHTNFPLKSS
jgi:hypothetical protein